MKTKCLSAILFCAVLLSHVFAQSADETLVRLSFPDRTPLHDLLMAYSHFAGRKVWIALGDYPSVSVMTERPMPRSEALALIRKTLLEQYGIEVRDNDKGETFVSWSNDPKYSHPISPASTPRSTRRVRILPTQPAEKDSQ